MQFDQFEMKDYLVKYLKDKGFTKLTDVQKLMLVEYKKKRNMIVTSKTGSGKTLSFLLPILNSIDLEDNKTNVLICVPTRELAMQIYNVVNEIKLSAKKNFLVKNFSGGSNKAGEVDWLNDNNPLICIGTPGKLNDLICKENVLLVNKASYLVVDEADMCFDSGFIHDLDSIYQKMSNPQVLVFSATINENLAHAIEKYLKTKLILRVDQKELENLNIEHVLLPTKGRDKLEVLNQLLKTFNPYLCLIFANTKERVDMVSNYLKNEGYTIGVMHGGIEMRERKRMMKQIHDLKFQYIVASDIAARGIDIEGVSHIINFDLPSDYEFYIHRTGRTGRANMSGVAISLYDFDNEEYINKIEKKGIRFTKKAIKDGYLV